MKKIIPCFLFLLLAGCRSKLSEPEKKMIFAFREMSDLATVEYTLSKVVKASDNATWYKFGDRKILMSVVAYVKAGVDLAAVKEENAELKKDNISILLPHAKIISLNIPPEEIREETQQTDFFRDRFKNEEKNALLIQAENEIRGSVDSLGILKTAEENTKLFLENFIRRLGYKNVTIRFDEAGSTDAKPIHQ
jgi:hypothetical protein